MMGFYMAAMDKDDMTESAPFASTVLAVGDIDSGTVSEVGS
jgi:hypothetical protein